MQLKGLLLPTKESLLRRTLRWRLSPMRSLTRYRHLLGWPTPRTRTEMKYQEATVEFHSTTPAVTATDCKSLKAASWHRLQFKRRKSRALWEERSIPGK